MKEKFNISINNNLLFDEVHRINQRSEQKADWTEDVINKKWMAIFDLLQYRDIPHNNIKISIEMALCLPGTNAIVERTFFNWNDICYLGK